MWMLVALLLVTAVLALLGLRHREPARRAIALRRAGLGWTLAFAVVAGLFVAGETGLDPGGWAAFWLDLSWLVPMLALTALAWWRPAAAAPVLVAATALGLVSDAVWTLAKEPGRGFDAPAGAISMFAVSVAVGVLGWHRPRLAAWLLGVVAVVPSVVEALGTDVPLKGLLGGSTAAGTVPFLVAAVLYALATWQQGRTGRAAPSRPLPPPVAIGR